MELTEALKLLIPNLLKKHRAKNLLKAFLNNETQEELISRCPVTITYAIPINMKTEISDFDDFHYLLLSPIANITKWE